MFDLPPPQPIAQIEYLTTGISKGLAQTLGPQVAARGGLAFGAFSIEANAKNIESGDDHGAETLLAVGAATKIGGFDLSAKGGLKTVHGIVTQVDRHAFEARVDAARKFGKLQATASVIYSPDDTGSTRSATFVEGGAAWEVRKGTRIGARIGRRERTLAPDYTAFNVGINQDIIPNVTADVRLYDTNKSELGYAYRRRVVGSLRAKF